MVKVFKTNVQSAEEVIKLLSKIQQYFPESRANFDLEDCDKILRVEQAGIQSAEIIKLLVSEGYTCEALL